VFGVMMMMMMMMMTVVVVVAAKFQIHDLKDGNSHCVTGYEQNKEESVSPSRLCHGSSEFNGISSHHVNVASEATVAKNIQKPSHEGHGRYEE
jgi:hypothetical protein